MSAVAALEICAGVAFYFHVAPADLSLASRTENWSHADDARAAAVYLIRRRTTLRTAHIARLFDVSADNSTSSIQSTYVYAADRVRRDPLFRKSISDVADWLDQISGVRPFTIKSLVAA